MLAVKRKRSNNVSVTCDKYLLQAGINLQSNIRGAAAFSNIWDYNKIVQSEEEIALREIGKCYCKPGLFTKLQIVKALFRIHLLVFGKVTLEHQHHGDSVFIYK